MLADGLKISWRNFRSGFIHNLAILFVLIISNAAILTILMLEGNANIKMMLLFTAIIGYVATILLATYAAKFRKKEVAIRKMLGARIAQIFVLTTIDTLLYTITSAIFSVIIVEHIYEHNEMLSTLSLLLIIKFLIVLFVLSLLISIFPAIKLNTFNSNNH